MNYIAFMDRRPQIVLSMFHSLICRYEKAVLNPLFEAKKEQPFVQYKRQDSSSFFAQYMHFSIRPTLPGMHEDQDEF